jgi:hypothetical protein
MGIPVGSVHNAQASAQTRGEYACAHCGCRAVAQAYGESQGVGFSPLWMREERAAQDALEEAKTFARSDADENIRIAPCPRCGKRQSGIALRYWGLWGFATALPILALPIAGCFLWLGQGVVGVLLTIVFVVAAIGVFSAAYRKWTRTSDVVRFRIVGEEPPSAA